MAFIPAKCTQCGANLTVDDTKDAGICEYCGTPFVTEKVIKNYNTYVTNNFSGASINVLGGDVDNFLKLSNAAFVAKNGNEAYVYANKALEIQPELSNAWFSKMQSLEFIGTIGDPRCSEVIVCGQNAIRYADEDEKNTIKHKVYSYFLRRSSELMAISIDNISNIGSVQKALKVNAQFAQNSDAATRDLYAKLAAFSINLKLGVPKEYITNNVDLQNVIKFIAQQYVQYCILDTNRIALYGSHLLDSAVTSRKNNLDLIKQGLSDELKNTIDDNQITKGNGNGCYIATAVYGSYDCAEVWVLRRFRDSFLKQTWYGKLFIRIYYKISPTLVCWFGHTNWFKNFWRMCLDKLIEVLKKHGYENTPYND